MTWNIFNIISCGMNITYSEIINFQFSLVSLIYNGVCIRWTINWKFYAISDYLSLSAPFNSSPIRLHIWTLWLSMHWLEQQFHVWLWYLVFSSLNKMCILWSNFMSILWFSNISIRSLHKHFNWYATTNGDFMSLPEIN